MITVIGGGKKGKERQLHASLVPVTSVLKGITYPPSMAEAVEIVDGSRTLVVILCHQEVNSPTRSYGGSGLHGIWKCNCL